MKKKLLITLGDSWAEGYGCYEKSFVPSHEYLNHLKYKSETKLQLDHFHEFGWPNRLGKKLNYDRIINLGYGGSGQSFHLKILYEKILSKDFSNYDILIVWMLAHPSRFSFYSGGVIHNFMPSVNSSGLGEEYVKQIKDIEGDSILETIFYIKCMEDVCENNNFNLLITSTNDYILKKIFEKYKSKYNFKGLNDTPLITDPNFLSNCSHPNELGYELISQKMFESIEKHYPQLINQNKVENFEWEYLGNPRYD